MVQIVTGEHLIIDWRYASPRRDASELSYEVAFLGACLGIALSRRGSGRDYSSVMFHILVEDDGQWSVKTGGICSAYWLSDLHKQVSAALEWLQNNAVKTPHGWEFK